MAYFSTSVAAASTVYSGSATPDVSIPFEPNQVTVVNSGATPIEVSAGAAKTLQGQTVLGVLLPSPHPSAMRSFRGNVQKLWVRNMTAGSSANVFISADDSGY